MKCKIFAAIGMAAFLLAACTQPATNETTENTMPEVSVSEMVPSAVIYEVNIRQYTPEGTFKAFTERHLDRLAELGVDILWIMPVHPVSVKNRKGELGSYYAVADYKGVNPEFGTLDDVKNLVDKAHEKGMLVILDWVANHTGWDNVWIEEHPEWFTTDEDGKIIIPEGTDWSDVADLNYDIPEMRAAMIDALKYWVDETDVDGYRCDVAGSVPTDFWNDARTALDSLKPVFMLAEAYEAELLDTAFNMAYGWDFHHAMNHVAGGEGNAQSIIDEIEKINNTYDADDIIMQFVTNHDENSWNGTVKERMHDAGKCFAALSYIAPGMPLIYSGQEAGLDKRLRFFAKDTISWADTSQYAFYKKLNVLKNNPALDAATKLGKEQMFTLADDKVLVLVRENGNNKIVGIFNLSENEQTISLPEDSELTEQSFTDIFTGTTFNTASTTMPAWDFKILEFKQ